MWRGGLPPLGREAPPAFQWVYDCFAVERGQAPSPQVASTGLSASSPLPPKTLYNVRLLAIPQSKEL
ncbi:hypothetical protein EAH78_22170 [Pseudomonas arsenicoxydans]|uniref:Uncharacterized protein n=1 Tax=Pseudomonas arsenicoxydans TaxID=702115 RepID=A0A502HJG5_9PSED|nr:hypothetical protein EAH78_22170 [Pseudomonas arsenicoxydans]